MFNWTIWKKYIFPVIVVYAIAVLIIFCLKIYFNLNTSDTLSLAQLVLSMLLLPTVIVGFTITVLAFRESQELPDLDVFMETETGLLQKSLKLKLRKKDDAATEETFYPIVPFVVMNTGNAIALWYAVHLEIGFKENPDIHMLALNERGCHSPQSSSHIISSLGS